MHHIESVDLGFVASEGVHQSHVEIVPNLDGLIPRGGHTDSWLLGVVELNARDGISVLILVNDVFALRPGVPDTDGSVKRSSDDLTVVWRESDRKNVFRVSNELVDGLCGGNFPKADSSVPRGGESKARITSQLNL